MICKCCEYLLLCQILFHPFVQVKVCQPAGMNTRTHSDTVFFYAVGISRRMIEDAGSLTSFLDICMVSRLNTCRSYD